ncbi:MAG: hypothetical protein WAO12_12970 [Venatoribacter sp.]
MFSFALAVVVLICAVPLSFAIGIALFYAGMASGIAAIVGISIFCVSSWMVISRLVFRDTQNSPQHS